MKKRTIFLLIVVLTTVSTFARSIRKEFNLPIFNKIEIGSAFSVKISQGNTQSVVFDIDEELFNYLKADVAGNKLKIRLENKIWKRGYDNLKVFITVTDLQGLEVGGACNVNFETAIESDEIKINLSGASRLSGERINANKTKIGLSGASHLNVGLHSSQLTLEASGASRAILKGNADKQSFEASGASNIEASDLSGESARVEASGASNIKLGTKSISHMNISGASSIKTK